MYLLALLSAAVVIASPFKQYDEETDFLPPPFIDNFEPPVTGLAAATETVGTETLVATESTVFATTTVAVTSLLLKKRQETFLTEDPSEVPTTTEIPTPTPEATTELPVEITTELPTETTTHEPAVIETEEPLATESIDAPEPTETEISTAFEDTTSVSFGAEPTAYYKKRQFYSEYEYPKTTETLEEFSTSAIRTVEKGTYSALPTTTYSAPFIKYRRYKRDGKDDKNEGKVKGRRPKVPTKTTVTEPATRITVTVTKEEADDDEDKTLEYPLSYTGGLKKRDAETETVTATPDYPLSYTGGMKKRDFTTEESAATATPDYPLSYTGGLKKRQAATDATTATLDYPLSYTGGMKKRDITTEEFAATATPDYPLSYTGGLKKRQAATDVTTATLDYPLSYTGGMKKRDIITEESVTTATPDYPLSYTGGMKKRQAETEITTATLDYPLSYTGGMKKRNFITISATQSTESIWATPAPTPAVTPSPKFLRMKRDEVSSTLDYPLSYTGGLYRRVYSTRVVVTSSAPLPTQSR